MFLPTTRKELKAWGWEAVDVILVTGDAYIDSPFVGVAVIARILLMAGYRVGVIAQPDIRTPGEINRLGKPLLFWGVTGGCLDSMVANYTATKKKRNRDDLTPGGRNTRRPDRALITYSNLIRSLPGERVPIVLGGIEASLRRIAHYDYWADRLRRAILCDAPADYLLYGMADKSILHFAAALKSGKYPGNIRGLCYLSREKRSDYLELPSFDKVSADDRIFTRMFRLFYEHSDPITARGLCQKQDGRYLIQNPPALPLTQAELDMVHSLPFTHDVHPFYGRQGQVKALETIRFSIPTHRGCYGECSFCSIAVHQGRTIQWRSEASILEEAKRLAAHPRFKGYIQDVGGPTANMYGFECTRKLKQGACREKRCIYPRVCHRLPVNHNRHMTVLRKLRRIPGVKKVFVASGLRYDLLLHDRKNGPVYLEELIRHHISGQMKVAPEHMENHILDLMKKPAAGQLLDFKNLFERLSCGRKKQYLTYYFIAAHPGCRERDMDVLRNLVDRELGIHPEQVQIFTPLPSTYASVMYYTNKDPFTGREIFVEKTISGKERQKARLVRKGRFGFAKG
ncbi:MAG: YgiQ family radical SAM protein [Syntrophales bacterium]|jgi:uncharacterized radical SAM protein YgiQ|nr:YgiQ family radical SAM protein [Syntrophales bacterium]NLN60380.1 YgiQ family radical SAM protein [Deltaproteobacteria bacterium]